MPTVRDRATGKVYEFDWNAPEPPTREQLGQIIEQKKREESQSDFSSTLLPETVKDVGGAVERGAKRAFNFMTSPIPYFERLVREHKPNLPPVVESMIAENPLVNPGAALGHNIQTLTNRMKSGDFDMGPRRDDEMMKLEQAVPSPIDIVSIPSPLTKAPGLAGILGRGARAAEIGVGAGMVGTGVGEMAHGDVGPGAVHALFGGLALAPFGKSREAVVPHDTPEGITEGLSRGYLREGKGAGDIDAGYFGRGGMESVMGSTDEVNQFVRDMEQTFGPEWPKHVLDDIPEAPQPLPPTRRAVAPPGTSDWEDIALDLEGAIENQPRTGSYTPAGGYFAKPRMGPSDDLARAVHEATSGPQQRTGLYTPEGEFTPRPRLAKKPQAEFGDIEPLERGPVDRTVESGGTGALSAEELSRQQRGEKYYKVTRGGEVTYYGNQPDPTKGLRNGEAVIRLRGDGTPEVAQTSGWTDNEALATFGRTEAGRTARPKVAESQRLGDFVEESPLAKSEIREGKVVGQTNPRLIREIGANLYQGDLGSVIVKEGLQNAVDSIRRGSKGNIGVDFDTDTKTITITDDGIGMAPDTVKNQFVNPGESFKPEGSRGGYGIAKVAMLSQADDIEVVSVHEMPDGTKVKSILKGDGNRWLDPEDPMDITVEPVPPETATGTSVKIRLDPKATFQDYQVQNYLQQFLQNEKTGHNYNFRRTKAGAVATTLERQTQEYAWHPEKGSVKVPAPTVIGTKDLGDGTEMEFFRKGGFHETSYVPVDVFNGGLPQFSTTIELGSEVRVPERIQVNIKTSLDTTHEGYPFTPNRQQLRDKAQTAVRQFVMDLGRKARDEEMERFRQAYYSGAHIGDTGYQLVDSTGNVPQNVLEQIADQPHVVALTQVINDGLRDAAQTIRKFVDNEADWTDFNSSIGWSGHKWLGLNIDAARMFGENPKNKFAILIDPWTISKALDSFSGVGVGGRTRTRAIGELTWGTMIHEIVHNKVRGHGVEHTGYMSRLIGALAHEGVAWIGKFEETVLNDERLAGLFGKLRNEYDWLKSNSADQNIFESIGVESDARNIRGAKGILDSGDATGSNAGGGASEGSAGNRQGKWTKDEVLEKITESGGDIDSVKVKGNIITWRDSAGNDRAVDLNGRIGLRNFGLSTRQRGTNPRNLATNPRSPLPSMLENPPGKFDPGTGPEPGKTPYDLRPKERGALVIGRNPQGPQTAAASTTAGTPRKATLGEKTADILNISRTLKSSLDLSMPLRQAGLFTVRHPLMAAKATKEMIKAMLSEDRYTDFMTDLHTRPNALKKRYIESGLAITEHPKHALTGKLKQREEAFLSTMVDWVPGVRASNRAAVAFLNYARAELFDNLAKKFKGLDVADKDIAKYVNIVTGRAGLGKHGERMATALQAVLFSPRFLASRIQSVTHALPGSNALGKALTGKTLLDPRLQKELRKDWAAYATAFAGVLSVAKLGGADVEFDPRSTDFLKIRFGKTRIDIGASYPQLGRLLAQLWTAERKLPSGEIAPVGRSRDSEVKKRGDVGLRFGRSKLNPPAGLLATAYAGRNYVGEPFDASNKWHWTRELAQMHTPMFLSDLADSIEEHGAAKGALFAVPSLIGGSTDVYDPDDPNRLDPDDFERRVKNWRRSRIGKLLLEEN